MEFTQSYAVPSVVTPRGEGLGFALAVEEARPGVHLEALVRHSTSYGRVMRALHSIVSSHAGFEAKDHSAYKEWVHGEYLKEIEPQLAEGVGRIPALQSEKGELHRQLKLLEAQRLQLWSENYRLRGRKSYIFNQARRRYWNYLYQHHRQLWIILDPVVSVHPDVVLFEVFSRDESSYGCVRVPTDNLDTFGSTAYGTTNVDYSQALADEMARVRDYRPAFLGVGSEGVVLRTTAGTRIEKKIDLPPSWVRGFLQVQSASSLTTVALQLSATTVSEVLRLLKARREKEGPRSLKFILSPNAFPVIEIQPWGEKVTEGRFRYQGQQAQEIRIWGRRRLMVLDDMLPYAHTVDVRLVGDGMPSFWSLELDGHRFELGLSGWTENDWSRAARYDLLASSGQTAPRKLELAAQKLESALLLSVEELTQATGWKRAEATQALQTLCRQGRALFDAVCNAYRWRPLLPGPVLEFDEDTKVKSARRWLKAGQVGVEPISDAEREANELLQRLDRETQLFRAQVQTEGGVLRPLLGLDTDGRVTFFQCTCADFRRDKGRKGPCGHVLAAVQSLMLHETRPEESVELEEISL